MIFLKGNGIIISKREIEEADRYIDIFFEDYGKISALIKGIRKSKKRDKTAVDLISLTNFSFYRKNENIIISDFSSVKSYEGIKKDISKLNIALYIFSVLNQTLVENGKNRKMYNLLEKTLNYLENSNVEKNNFILVLYFLHELIKDEGIAPENDCVEHFLIDINIKQLDKTKEILEKISKLKVKELINNANVSVMDIIKSVTILEKYINNNLDTYINIKKFLWGDFLW